MSGQVYIGTSGWNYDSWKGAFYGATPKKDWLRFCAERFNAIEVNATFYRLQSRETFRRWHDVTPPGFRFAIKGNRFLTHNKKLADWNEARAARQGGRACGLADPLPAIRLERERAAGLGDKLAAVVWQLPHNFHKHLDRLEGFARALKRWQRPRHAIEFRHESWFDAEVADCLRRHDIAVCQSDAADWPLWDAVTTDLVYVRLHGHTLTYASGYSDTLLRGWAEKIRRWRRKGFEVHVYFDNDAFGYAPFDALRLMKFTGTARD